MTDSQWISASVNINTVQIRIRKVLIISLLIQPIIANNLQNIYEVKCKEKTSVYITRVWYSSLQLSIRGKQFEKFHIKGIVVSGDDFNEQATIFNIMNTRFGSVDNFSAVTEVHGSRRTIQDYFLYRLDTMIAKTVLVGLSGSRFEANILPPL